jgi:hypothetical protein
MLDILLAQSDTTDTLSVALFKDDASFAKSEATLITTIAFLCLVK